MIRPYFSDRAKLLMSKCDPTHSAKYENIKSFLLKELHLSPAVYLEKLIQDKSKTYTQFSTRLISLFEYYLESRKIGQSYDKLTDLMVYDRVKSCYSKKSSSRGFTPNAVSRPQVNFCRTKQKVDPPKQSNDGARVTRDRSAGVATCSNCNPVSGADYESSCESSSANAVVSKCDMQLAKETTWIGNRH